MDMWTLLLLVEVLYYKMEANETSQEEHYSKRRFTKY